ncbi:hypothetical protein OPT61_g3197 [Boeremia exigua]|uniref:Uncharacterized protein n=1 Tax=Boeremia exigua TaxID=749465 RepID=A0ACC2IIX5_9PLEO|nr:hypothetical protein OPT61_g3197 [Boeremia exigua]
MALRSGSLRSLSCYASSTSMRASKCSHILGKILREVEVMRTTQQDSQDSIWGLGTAQQDSQDSIRELRTAQRKNNHELELLKHSVRAELEILKKNSPKILDLLAVERRIDELIIHILTGIILVVVAVPIIYNVVRVVRP